MCNIASEGGRCYAHIVQRINSLKAQDEKNLLIEARKAGVPEIPMEETDEYIKSKGKVMASYETAMKAKEDYKESLEKRVPLSQAIKAGKANLVAKFKAPEDAPYEYEEFYGYSEENVTNYVQAYAFRNATAQRYHEMDMEILGQNRAIQDARNAEVEKKLLEEDEELKRARDRIIAERGPKVDPRTMGSYKHALTMAMRRVGHNENAEDFVDKTELRSMKAKWDKANEDYDAEVKKYYNHVLSPENKLVTENPNHRAEGAYLATRGKNSIESKLASRNLGSYEELNLRHEKANFENNKKELEAYVEAVSKGKITNFKPEALAEFKSTTYPTLPSAQKLSNEIKTQKMDLVVTPGYRKIMASRLVGMPASSEEAKEIKRKLSLFEKDYNQRILDAGGTIKPKRSGIRNMMSKSTKLSKE